MACELLLGVRLNSAEKMNVIKLNDINLKEKVEKLRNETASQTNLSSNSFNLIYCGCLLDNDSNTLESYGLKNGSMVHVVKKKETKEAASSSSGTPIGETNIETLSTVFKSFYGNPLLQLAMRRLTKSPEVIENIISSSPGLNEDAVAIAILQDPDLIVHFTNPETIKKIAKQHPALLEAAQHIASAVHDEAHTFAASVSTADSINNSMTDYLNNAMTTGHSYSLENLSDDEEMAGDSSQSSDSTQPSNSANQSRNQSGSITGAQLLAAIARAQRSTSGSGSAAGSTGNGSSPVSSGISRTNSNSGTSAGGPITFEMFNQAMQQAFAYTPPSNNSTNSVPAQTPPAPTTFTPPAPATFSPPQESTQNSENLQQQISIMHEMGLQNDAINIQALRVTNGDVQAAIELVLNGFGDN